jgi:hypothetical protein
MNEEAYLDLLSLLTPLIKKQGIIMRGAATLHERLPAILRISLQALSCVLPETCHAIYEVLKRSYLKVRKTAVLN